MTPAEKRIKELIDRWLTSIELHLQYTELSDEAYAEIQAWPKHDRPTRWVLELAKQKAGELKTAFDARHQMGDSKFADALELMSFLANLVGAQHVDRFVPLAEPQQDTSVPKPTPRVVKSTPEVSDIPKWYAQAQIAPPTQSKAPTKPPALQVDTTPATRPLASANPLPKPTSREPDRMADPEATREMPKPVIKKSPAPAAAAKPAAAASTNAAKPPTQPKPAAANSGAGLTEIQQIVIADAERLLTWGRTWHELAELITRMADRPSLGEVRKILRANRAAIEQAVKKQ